MFWINNVKFLFIASEHNSDFILQSNRFWFELIAIIIILLDNLIDFYDDHKKMGFNLKKFKAPIF